MKLDASAVLEQLAQKAAQERTAMEALIDSIQSLANRLEIPTTANVPLQDRSEFAGDEERHTVESLARQVDQLLATRTRLLCTLQVIELVSMRVMHAARQGRTEA